MSYKLLAESSESCVAEAHDEREDVKIWLKSDPVDRDFCNRATQLQLYTDSCDQGFVDDETLGSFSWFEIALLPDSQSSEPIVKDKQKLVWHSHYNRLNSGSLSGLSRHFGVNFDRSKDIWEHIQPGNIIAVRVCAKYPGWVNRASKGRLSAKVLDVDIFATKEWALLSETDDDDLPLTVTSGVYTLASAKECHVKVEIDENDPLSYSKTFSKVWFTTPRLDERVLATIQQLQLFTTSHDQGWADDKSSSWSWFDIMILESPWDTEPKVKDGRAMVWSSHENPVASENDVKLRGKVFGQNEELFASLEVGNVIAVRACCRFQGWENHATEAHLVVQIAHDALSRHPPKPPVDYAAAAKRKEELKRMLGIYLNSLTPSDQLPAYSIPNELLGQSVRADLSRGAGERPLRLLSLDGGGVRGISSLYILKEIMTHVTGGANARPCDYFDMMAGTSTGGLIAVMLGRLGMTVDECIEAYKDLSKRIFDAWAVTKTGRQQAYGYQYDAGKLEAAVKAIVKKYTGDENAPMRNPDPDACKVFVLTCRMDNMNNRLATHVRTYYTQTETEADPMFTIWEAARATSAAPTYFQHLEKDKQGYVDGGLAANNPVLMLISEVSTYYGEYRPFGCLLTVGTGMAKNVQLPSEGPYLIYGPKLAIALADAATGTEAAHLIAQTWPGVSGAYYRFTVGIKNGDDWEELIKLDKWDQMPKLIAQTATYLAGDGEKKRVSECAVKLVPKLK